MSDHPVHAPEDSVEYALQCVLAARQDLSQVVAGDTEALASLTAALEEATARLYAASSVKG